MRVSTLYKPQPGTPHTERVPVVRVALWTAMALVLAAGIALYFVFERGVTPLL